MDLELTDRICIVTGASRGIGLATTRLLVREGASVLMVGRDGQALVDAAEGCGGRGRVSVHADDITDPDAPQRIEAACAQALGEPDVLVNNAGTSSVVALEDLDDAQWHSQWELHVMGPMRLMRLLAPAMADRGFGRVVNVNSSSGKRPSQNNMAYSVTKAAELSLSRSFAELYAGRGVNVNTVMPGPVDTGLWMDEGGMADQKAAALGVSREEVLERQYAKIPSGRYATAEEIARVIVALCSPIGDNVHGAAWASDGGAVGLLF